MAQPEYLVLVIGESLSLAVARYTAWCLACAAALSAPAGWLWKVALVAALMLFRPRPAARGRVRLFRDGGAFLEIAHGQAGLASLAPGPWLSRWFSVLPLSGPDDKRVRRMVVCAASNRPDDYRRLLQWLSLTAPRAIGITERGR